jgi:hypothetical protein
MSALNLAKSLQSSKSTTSTAMFRFVYSACHRDIIGVFCVHGYKLGATVVVPDESSGDAASSSSFRRRLRSSQTTGIRLLATYSISTR